MRQRLSRIWNSFPRPLRWVTELMLFFLMVLTLYRLLFYTVYLPEGRPFSGSVFLLGLRYDLRAVAVLGMLVLLLLLMPRCHPIRNPGARPYWTVGLGLIFVTVLLFLGADFYHFDYLRQRLNAAALHLLADAGISLRMVWQTYPVLRLSLLLLVAWMGYQGLMSYRLRRIAAAEAPPGRRFWPYYLGFILLLALCLFGRVGQYPLRWSDAFTLTDEFKSQAALNPFQSFVSTFRFRHSGYDMKQVREAYPMMAAELGVDHPDPATLDFSRVQAPAAGEGKPNMVLVICESFSASKSSMFGNPLDPTPFFHKMCREGVFFDRCFTPAFGTARGVWATLTGIPDVESPRTSSRNPAAVDQQILLSDLKGYDTYYFLGGSTTWANIRGLLQHNIEGLRIVEEGGFEAERVDVWGISDKNLFLESRRMLSASPRPFFAVIQTADNHRPYTIPQEDIGAFQKVELPADTLKKYGFEDNAQYNAFRYSDFCFRTFMESAARLPFFQNTIFAFVGDHGLRGDAGPGFPRSFTAQGIAAEHVPLLFYAPGRLPARRVSRVCSQTDVLPSLLALAGQGYVNGTLGRNLFDSTRRLPAWAFIADPDLATIGVVDDSFYYRRHLPTNREDFVSVTGNDPPATDPQTRAREVRLKVLTQACYETSRYLLTHNRKRKRGM